MAVLVVVGARVAADGASVVTGVGTVVVDAMVGLGVISKTVSSNRDMELLQEEGKSSLGG